MAEWQNSAMKLMEILLTFEKNHSEKILRLKFLMSEKNAKAIEKNAYAKQKLERKCRKKTVGYAKLF